VPRASELRSGFGDRKSDAFPLGLPSFTLGKLYRRKICQLASLFFPRN
jgi:hypothetical protein